MTLVFGPPRKQRALLIRHDTASGAPVTLGCDGKCSKAFGINGRPRIALSKRDDDTIWVPDALLPEAPPPGETLCIAHNGRKKPSATNLGATDAAKMNAWCLYECERAEKVYGKHVASLLVPDLNTPKPNIPR